MFLYLAKKAFLLFFSLWCVITGTFFLMHAIPGDPFIGDRAIPEEVLRSLRAYFGLDQPLWIQYWTYLKGLLSGDLGPSIVYPGRTVNQFIAQGFPISARLGIQALLVAIPAGILLGTWAALKKRGWQDHAAMALSTLGISVPSFVLSTLLQLVFSVKLHLLPIARLDEFGSTILPTLALSALPTAFTARLIRESLCEAMSQEYIKTALAKGIPLFRVALRHGLRNGILPVVAYLGTAASQILTGSFVVEKIFAIPGLGQWMIHSIGARDYPMILGLTVFFSAFLMTSTFLADLLYTLLDPRIRFFKKETYA